VKLLLDLNSVDGYRTFLKVKALPIHSFTGREAWFPDEYAERLGLSAGASNGMAYTANPKLFDYQKAIAKIAISKRKYAVFMEPGRGKTLIDFEYAHHAMNETGGRVLIVCPPMVIQQMIDEHAKFYPSMDGPERVRAAGLQEWLDGRGPAFGITNYEAIREGLTAGNLSALILSESSMLKSHYGKWGTRLIELGRGLHWKLCETGTPAPNDRIEYANHAVFLDQFPTVNSFLAKFFVNRGETANRWELKPHALRPFYRALSHWCIFMSNPATYGWKDNTAPLPPIRTHIIDVPLSDRQRDEAMKLTGNLWGAPGGIGQRQKVARIAKGSLGSRPEFVASLVEQDKSPCLIWCKYNQEQDDLERRIKNVASISGATPEDDRIDMIREYQSGKRTRLMSKPKILGFGLNLQVTRRMVFSTLQDSYEDYFQCVKRANRTGSSQPLDVYAPVTELERPMMENVLVKAARVEADTQEQEQLFKEVGCGI